MKKHTLLCLAAITCILFAFKTTQKPVLYIIGDSTVKNGSGSGDKKLWGWGSFIAAYYDTAKLGIANHAIGGRSSRTFITEGRWDKVMETLKPGDMVIMQFGHNDSSPLDDTARARGTIKGTGNDSTEIYNPILKKKEMVHTYGWYMQQFITGAKAKGAIPIVCSPVPRDNWKDGKVKRGNEDYGKWAKEKAAENGAYFIDLNNLIADEYDKLGQDSVHHFFPVDHTHPNEAGSRIAAAIVVTELGKIKELHLKKYQH